MDTLPILLPVRDRKRCKGGKIMSLIVELTKVSRLSSDGNTADVRGGGGSGYRETDREETIGGQRIWVNWNSSM